MRLKSVSSCYVRCLAFIVCFFAFFIFNSPALIAQTPDQNLSALEIPGGEIARYDKNLAPYITLVPDQPGQTTFQTVQRYRQQYAYMLSGDIKNINLGMEGGAYWILFSIQNNSQQESFYLDFGGLKQGRVGNLKELFVYNNTKERQIVDFLETRDSGKSQLRHPSLVSLDIPPGQTVRYTAYISTYKYMPTSLAPRLLSSQKTLRSLQTPDYFDIAFYVIGFMAVALIMLGGRIKRWPAKLGYTGYVLCLCLSYGLFNKTLVDQDIVLAMMPYSLILLGFVMALAGLAIHSSKSYKSALKALLPFILLTAGLVAAFLFKIFPSFIESYIFHVCVVLCFLTALFLIIRARRRIIRSWHLVAWGALASGYLYVISSFIGFTALTPASIHSLWIGFLVHTLMIAISAQARILGSEIDFDEFDLSESTQEDQSPEVKKLQEHKERSDYHKLLKVVERERETMNELREKEAERVDQMRRAKVAADEANRAKSAFLAVVSHEIRTPMTGIMGMVRLLKDTKLSSSQRDYTDTIQESSEAMLSLLNDILDFEKVESGQMELEEVDFDLRRLIQSVASLMKGQASNKNNKLEVKMGTTVPQFIKGDPKRLKQVLLNLVGNAIKFTKDGTITINIQNLKEDQKADSKNQHDIYFSVEDTGIGIPKKAQKNLFNPFAQADRSITRKYGGTGLGLAISQKLIEAMGGFISVNSAEGEGSTFFFSILFQGGDAKEARNIDEDKERREALPNYEEIKKNQRLLKRRNMPSQTEIGESDKDIIVSADSGPQSTQDFVSREAPRQEEDGLMRCSGPQETAKNILVIDDNNINRKVMTGLVNRLDHNVKTVEDAQSGIQAAHERIWDLIFMDIELPDMMGTEAAKQILSSKSKFVRETPIVALTGNVRSEDLSRYRQVGMLDTLSKPVKPEALQQIIDSFPKRTAEEDSDTKGEEDKSDGSMQSEEKPDKQDDLSLLSQSDDSNLKEDLSSSENKASHISQEHDPQEGFEEQEPRNHEDQELDIDEDFYDEGPVLKSGNVSEEKGGDRAVELKTGINENIDDLGMMDLEAAVEAMNVKARKKQFDVPDLSSKTKPDISKETTHNTQIKPGQSSQKPGKDKDINKEIESLNEIDIFDDNVLSALSETLASDKIDELTEEFWVKAQETIKELENTSQSTNLQFIRQKAHDLKGMAGNFGLMQMSAMADRIEYEAKYDDQDYSLKLINLLPACYKKSHEALDEWVQQVKETNTDGEGESISQGSDQGKKERPQYKEPHVNDQGETPSHEAHEETKESDKPEGQDVFNAQMLEVVAKSMSKSQLMGYLKGFCSKIDSEIEALSQSIENQDLEKAQKQTDQIGLMAENFGLHEVNSLSEKAKAGIKNSDMVQLELVSDELKQAVERAQEALEKWVMRKDNS